MDIFLKSIILKTKLIFKKGLDIQNIFLTVLHKNYKLLLI